MTVSEVPDLLRPLLRALGRGDREVHETGQLSDLDASAGRMTKALPTLRRERLVALERRDLGHLAGGAGDAHDRLGVASRPRSGRIGRLALRPPVMRPHEDVPRMEQRRQSIDAPQRCARAVSVGSDHLVHVRRVDPHDVTQDARAARLGGLPPNFSDNEAAVALRTVVGEEPNMAKDHGDVGAVCGQAVRRFAKLGG